MSEELEETNSEEIYLENKDAASDLDGQTRIRIYELFDRFLTEPEFKINFFNEGGSNKLHDYLQFIVILYSKFRPTDAIDITKLYNDSIKEQKLFPCHRFIFLINIINFFVKKAILHLMANIKYILDIYYSLIVEVYEKEKNRDRIKVTFEKGINSLENAMKKEVQIAGVVANWMKQNTCEKWDNEQNVDIAFLNFIKWLKWPLIKNKDGSSFIIESIVLMLVNNKMEPKLEQVLTEASVYQILSLRGYPEQSILENLPLLDNDELKTSPNMRAQATFALYSLLPKKTKLINLKSFAVLVRLLSKSIDFSPALLICKKFLKDVVSPNNPDVSKYFSYLSLILMSIVLNLSRLNKKDQSIVTAILNLFLNVNQNETYKIINQFFCEQKCPKDLLQVLINFAVKQSIDLQFFVPVELAHCISFLKMLIGSAKSSIENHDTLYNIFLFLQGCLKIIYNKIETTSEFNDVLDKDLLKIDRLCYFCFYFPNNIKIRCLANEILFTVASIFEKIHQDWVTYNNSEQGFARHINKIFKKYAKLNHIESKTPHDVLTKETERLNALNYISRKISTKRVQFSLVMMKKAFDISEKAPYLMDLTACLMDPETILITGKYSVRPLEFFTKCIKIGDFSSLKLLHISHFSAIMKRMISETPSPLFIPAFEAMTECAINNINSITLEIINLQISFLDHFIRSSPQYISQIWVFTNSISNISKEIMHCEAIKKLPPFFVQLQQFCLSAAQGDTQILHPEIFGTLLETLLAQLKFETPIDLVASVLRLPLSYDSPSTSDFCEKVYKYYPEKFLQIMKESYKLLPNVVAKILLDNSIPDMNFFTLFCFFMSDKTNPDLIKSSEKFLSESYPNISFKGLSRIEMIDLFMKEIPDLSDYFLSSCIEFYEVRNQMIEVKLRLFDILIPLPKYVQNRINELIDFGIVISQELILTTNILSVFWSTLMKDEKSTELVFNLFFKKGVDDYLIDHAFNLCEYKESVIKLSHDILKKNLTMMIAKKETKQLLTLYNIATRCNSFKPGVMISTSLFLQMEGAETCYNAYKFIKNVTKLQELPKIRYQILYLVCQGSKEDLKEIYEIIDNLFDMCGNTYMPFQYLFHTIAILARLFPKKTNKYLFNNSANSPTLNKGFGNLIETEVIRNNPIIFERFFHETYFLLSKMLYLNDVSYYLENYLLNLGFVCARLKMKKFDEAFLQYIAVLSQKNYFQQASIEQIRETISLLLFDDNYSTTISLIVINSLPIDKINDKIAKFLIDLANGCAILIEDKQIFDKLKEASVFGQSMTYQLITRLFQESPCIYTNEGIISPLISEFTSFLLLSEEVNSRYAIPLVSVIEEKYGNITINPVPQDKKYVKDLSYVLSYLKSK